MKSLKLNKLNQNTLSKDHMRRVLGGQGNLCSCGCCYVNQGGSNTVDNAIANNEGSLLSPNCDKATN
jgi:natural product precursor